MTGHDDFERALDAAPDDQGLRLVYADWLQDRGEDDRAAFLRWAARHEKRPIFRHNEMHDTPWRWSARPGEFDASECAVPVGVFMALGELPPNAEVSTEEFRRAEGRHLGGAPERSFYLTRRSAEAALFAAWVAAGKPEGL